MNCCDALQNSLGTLANTHNSQLTSAVAAFNTSNAGAQITVYNVSSLFSAVIASPANYANPVAFTNVTGPCRAGDLDTVQAAGYSAPNCPNGDAYVFWDNVSSSLTCLSRTINAPFWPRTIVCTSIDCLSTWVLGFWISQLRPSI